MQIALTKKVQDYLGIKTLESYKEQDYFLNDWAVHFTTVQRRKLFIFYNPKTKFSVVLISPEKKVLFDLFFESLILELHYTGVPKEYIRNIPFVFSGIRLVKNNDRSVSATITQIIKGIEYFYYPDKTTAAELNEWLNSHLRKADLDDPEIDYSFPVCNLIEELDLPYLIIKYERMKKYIKIV